MSTVTFTCTILGDVLRWEPSDVSNIVVSTSTTPLNMPEMPIPGYTVTLTAFNETSLTSTLSRRAEDGITVTCQDPRTATLIGSQTIKLAGELLQVFCGNLFKLQNKRQEIYNTALSAY